MIELDLAFEIAMDLELAIMMTMDLAMTALTAALNWAKDMAAAMTRMDLNMGMDYGYGKTWS